MQNNSSVIFRIHDIDDIKEMTCFLNEKIIDIKNRILKDIFLNKFNYLDLENITDRVYKDYGRLFFEKGLLPETIDNYKLSEFTVDNRTFSFVAIPRNREIIKNIRKEENINLVKKYSSKNDNKNNGYFYDECEFPPLK